MSALAVLDIAKVLLCSASLTYASACDLKTREVSNKLWILTYPLGLALTLYDLEDILLLTVSVATAFTLGVALFYLNLFGGADSKAIIMISLFLPSDPGLTEPFLGYVLPIFPLSVFFNSTILSALLPVTYFVMNLKRHLTEGRLFEGFEEEPLRRKIVAMFSLAKVKAEEFRGPPFQYLAEKGDRLVISARLREEEEQADDVTKEEVWVSPTLPFIIFITLGFFAAIYLGDIVFWFTRLVLESVTT